MGAICSQVKFCSGGCFWKQVGLLHCLLAAVGRDANVQAVEAPAGEGAGTCWVPWTPCVFSVAVLVSACFERLHPGPKARGRAVLSSCLASSGFSYLFFSASVVGFHLSLKEKEKQSSSSAALITNYFFLFLTFSTQF